MSKTSTSSNDYSSLNLDGYEVLQRLGSGSYSTVLKAIDRVTSETVAVKCVQKTKLSPSGRDNIVREISIMKMLESQFIVKMIDFHYDDKFIYIALEYCDGGDLSKFIQRRQKLPERICKRFMQQLVFGLRYLQQKGISHLDLKPQNLLLMKTTQSVTLKIGDFGFSDFLSAEAKTDTLRGSPLYMAPEMLLAEGVNAKADLWSVGVIFFECLFGEAPLAHSNCKQLVIILKNKVPIEIPEGPSDTARDLIGRLLVYSPEERISFEELYEHSFIDLERYPTDASYREAVIRARNAVIFDFNKQYLNAFNMYCAALQYLLPFLDDDLPPERYKFIKSKVTEYMNRAEQLKVVLHKAKNNLFADPFPSIAKQEVPGENTSKFPSNIFEVNDSCEDFTLELSEDPTTRPTTAHDDRLPQETPIGVSQVPDLEESINVPPIQSDLEGVEPRGTQSLTASKIDIKAFKTMCKSTPNLTDAIDLGFAAQLYLYEGNYKLSLDKFKTSFNLLLPIIREEPEGLRRKMLILQVQEWLKQAESASSLLYAKEMTDQSPTEIDEEALEKPEKENCVIQ